MANWKKVVVSGSVVSQLQNDAGYLTSGTIVQANGFATASVGAVEVLAKSSTGSFSYASGSGNGLNITGNAGTNVITFDLANIPNTSLTNDDVTIGSTAIALGGTSTTLEGLTIVSATSFSGSFSGSFEGNGSLLTGVTAASLPNSLVDGNGIADFTFDGSAGATVAVQADGSTLTVGAGGVKVADAGITATQIATSVAGNGLSGGGGTALAVNVDDSSIEINTDALRVKALGVTNAMLTNDDVTIGSTAIALGGTSTTLSGLTNVSSTSFSGSFSGSFEGNGSLLTGIASTLTVQGDTGGTSTVDLLTQTFDVAGGTNINTVTSGQTVTVNLDSVISVTDATVTGDLIVQGTASFQNTENLQIADRFILMASGSTSVGDGGIVVQQATQDFGELFGYDQANTRWAVTGSFDSATSAFTPDAFMSTVVEGVGADPAAVVAKYTNKGNIFVGNDEGIWIYS